MQINENTKNRAGPNWDRTRTEFEPDSRTELRTELESEPQPDYCRVLSRQPTPAANTARRNPANVSTA